MARNDRAHVESQTIRFLTDIQAAVTSVMLRDGISYRELSRRTGIDRQLLFDRLTSTDGVTLDLRDLVEVFCATGYVARLTLEPVDPKAGEARRDKEG